MKGGRNRTRPEGCEQESCSELILIFFYLVNLGIFLIVGWGFSKLFSSGVIFIALQDQNLSFVGFLGNTIF